MTSDQILTLAASSLAFLASVIATAVTIYNSRFQRFARERFWERKLEAYSKVTSALSSMVYYYEEHYEAAIEGRKVTDGRISEIEEHWRRGYEEVKLSTAVGAFLLSSKAQKALETMWRERGKDVPRDDWFGQIDSQYAAAKTCLRSVVEAARDDLRVKW